MLIPSKTKNLKDLCLRNAYQMNLVREYNSGKSLRHPTRVKMYADLTGKINGKKLGIKSLNDNKLSLAFNHMDLMRNGKVNEQSFLQLLPNQIDQFIDRMRETASTNMLGSAYFASLTVTGTAAGVLEVDHVERFTIGQSFVLDDGDTGQGTYFVIAVDVNGGTLLNGSITVSATSGGGAADVSTFSTGQNGRCYHPGVLIAGTVTNRFTSLRDSLLSLANGGTTTLYGKTKTTLKVA